MRSRWSASAPTSTSSRWPDTADACGQATYHANVMMCIATEFVLIGPDCITDAARRAEVAARLEESGREVIALSQAQIDAFAGNALELSGREGRWLALSQTAAASLSAEQRLRIEACARLLPLGVPTIDLAGGSVRCMLAGIHLSRRG